MIRPTRTRRSDKEGMVIELSDIRYDSTCLTLNLPKCLCCDNCEHKVEASIGLAKKSSMKTKSFRTMSPRRRCQQLWLSKFAEDTMPTGKVQKHNRTRNYLNIRPDVIIDYENKYINYKDYKVSWPSDPPSGPIVPTPMTIPTPTANNDEDNDGDEPTPQSLSQASQASSSIVLSHSSSFYQQSKISYQQS